VPPDEWYGRVIDAVLAVAAKENTPLINLNSAMRDLRKRAKESNQPAIPLTAGTTLGPAGHAMAALLVLRALGLDASPASVEIDASTGKSNCIRCKIEGLAVAGDRLSFARTDEALPMAFPPEVKPVLSMLPGHEFNSYGLKVTGLKAGTWKLKVQDREIGLFTAAELAAGVDLSNLPGPWRELADGVHRKSIAIEDAFSLRCHYGSEPRIPAGAEPQRRALVDKLDAGIEKLVAEQAEMMHAPTTWNWSLSLDKP
jgi:hypothetical protein